MLLNNSQIPGTPHIELVFHGSYLIIHLIITTDLSRLDNVNHLQTVYTHTSAHKHLDGALK